MLEKMIVPKAIMLDWERLRTKGDAQNIAKLTPETDKSSERTVLKFLNTGATVNYSLFETAKKYYADKEREINKVE